MCERVHHGIVCRLAEVKKDINFHSSEAIIALHVKRERSFWMLILVSKEEEAQKRKHWELIGAMFGRPPSRWLAPQLIQSHERKHATLDRFYDFSPYFGRKAINAESFERFSWQLIQANKEKPSIRLSPFS